MTVAKSLTGYTESLDPVVVQAYDAINLFNEVIASQTTIAIKTAAIYALEDALNPISGQILQQSPEVITDIRTQCAASVSLAGSYGFMVNLVDTLLPDNTPASTYVTKNLNPWTETAVVPTTSTVQPLVTTSVNTTDYTLIDEIVVDTAATPTAYSPINVGLLPIATLVASNSSLQDGLANISYNPMANTIGAAKSAILYYTENNFANLDIKLATIAADGSLTNQYLLLKDAIGGGDGLSGCISQLDSLKEHTDRLSGLKLESENEFAPQTDDSVTEQYFYYNLPASVSTQFGSFNAKYYRSAKYYVQATAAKEHQLTELMVVHDNSFAYARVVDDVYTRDPFVTYNAILSGGKINLYANTTIANTDLVVYGTKLQIAKDSSSPERMSQFKILDSHNILSTYYNDGTDYISLQTQSLQRGNTVAELQRDFNDTLNLLVIPPFTTMSTADKQNFILSQANAINNLNRSLQSYIDSDYTQYQIAEKKAQAIRILNQMSNSYSDPYAKNLIDSTTLDSVKRYL